MKLSLTLTGLFTASFLWCQGLSLTVETSTNAGNSSERLAEEEESYRRPVKDVGGAVTVKDSTAEYDISAVQKSRSLQTMIHQWVPRGNTVSADSSSFSREGFGSSVALSRNGKLLVVGAPEADDLGTPDDPSERDGKIEIYELANSQWNLLQTVFGVSGTAEGGKGENVSITPNGKRIAVQNSGSYATGGSFSVYEKNEVTGLFILLGSTIPAEIDDDGYVYASFGKGINISQDGNRVVFGSPDFNSMGGAAYVYEYISLQWVKIWEEKGTSTQMQAIGYDVSMSNDGKSILLLTQNQAAVDVWVEDATGIWTSHSLDLSDPAIPSTSFSRVAMSGDGMHIVVTDAYIGSSGYAYVFDKVGPDLDDWQLNINTPLMPNLSPNQACGTDVAISRNGKFFIMACSGQSFDAGSAIVYEEDDSGAWSQVGQEILKTDTYGANVHSVAIRDKKGNNAGTDVVVGSRTFVTLNPIGSATVYNLSSVPCIDSPAEIRMESMYSDKIPFFCRWVNRGQGSTCSDTGYLRGHCPSSCGSCAMLGCSDSSARFVVNGGETDCMTLMASGDQTLIDILCGNNRIRKSCRGTCGYCPFPIEV